MVNGKSKGVPNAATQRTVKKEVRSRVVSFDSRPSWRFSTVDKEGPFAWPIGKKEELEIVNSGKNIPVAWTGSVWRATRTLLEKILLLVTAIKGGRGKASKWMVRRKLLCNIQEYFEWQALSNFDAPL